MSVAFEPMRVLLLVHGLPVGGTEVMACHLARGLRARGETVEVGCLDELGELGELLRAEGFAVRCYGRRPGFDALLPLRIARHARDFGAQVVHAHQYTAFFYGVLAKLLARAALVFTEHGRQHPDLPGRRRRVFNRLFASHAERVTAVSEGVRRALHEVEGFDPARIQIVPNGIDVERFAAGSRRDARRELGLAEELPVVGTVGRLDPIKNYPLLLEAFRRLRGRLPSARLLVVGDGPERARLEATAAALGLRASVDFLGRRLNLERLYPALDLFALSSFSEGLPMTVIEAMAAGVPVVATDVGGIGEAIRDGEDGLLLPPPPALDSDEARAASRYPGRYADALAQLLQDHAARSRMADAGRERARRLYSLVAVCDRYRQLYREAASATPALTPSAS